MPRSADYRVLTAGLDGEIPYLPFPGLIDQVIVTTDLARRLGDGTTHAIRLDEFVDDHKDQVSEHCPAVSSTRSEPSRT